MPSLISEHNPGDTVTLKINRGGKEVELSVTFWTSSRFIYKWHPSNISSNLVTKPLSRKVVFEIKPKS